MAPQPASPRHAIARRIIIDLAVMTGIGVFLAVIGPFGSIAAPLPERLVSWIGFAWLGYACYRPMQSVVDWGERTLALPRWGLLAATCLAATVPMSVAVVAINSLPTSGLRWPGLEAAMATYFSVLVIGGAVTVLFNLVPSRPSEAMPVTAPLAAATAAPVALAAAPAPPPFRPHPHRTWRRTRWPIRYSISFRQNWAVTSSRWRWRITMSAFTPCWDRHWC